MAFNEGEMKIIYAMGAEHVFDQTLHIWRGFVETLASGANGDVNPAYDAYKALDLLHDCHIQTAVDYLNNVGKYSDNPLIDKHLKSIQNYVIWQTSLQGEQFFRAKYIDGKKKVPEEIINVYNKLCKRNIIYRYGKDFDGESK